MATVSLRSGLARTKPPRLLFATRTTQTRIQRFIHYRRELPYPVEGGVGEFLSPEGLRTLAIDYQEGLLERLNDEIRLKDHLANKSVVDVVIQSAATVSDTLAFNYSSLALNNSYFLDCIKPPEVDYPNHERHLTPLLHGRIRTGYDSLDNLKSHFSAAAEGLFAGGYTWLVTDSIGHLAVVNTHGAGSLLVASRVERRPAHSVGPVLGEDISGGLRQRAEEDDPPPFPLTDIPPHSHPDGPSATSPVSGLSFSSQSPSPPPNARAFHSTSRISLDLPSAPKNFFDMPAARPSYEPRYPAHPDANPATTFGDTYAGSAVGARTSQDESKMERMGENLGPLFCISAYEHAWMGAGYGVWGKREYLRRFWDVLDWEKVSKAYERWVPGNVISSNRI